MTGRGLKLAQDPERAQAWIMYSFSNYGVAIVAVLLLRLAGRACVGRSICSQEGNRGGHSRSDTRDVYMTTPGD
jgi:hypothetical protein